MEAAKEAWLACDLFKPARRHPALKAKLAEMVADYSGSLWLSDRRFLHNDTWQRVAEVTATTLVIVGALDLDDFQHSAEWISSRVLGARKHVLPDSGHMSNMEQSAAFNEELLAFLDERP